MRKGILTLLIALLMAVADATCQTASVKSSVRCLGVELDGTQTLRVQGYGRNRRDARMQAKKNAVWAVIFDGIRDGAGGCEMRPLVTEANARERHEDYFNRFFQDSGDWSEYVSLRDSKFLSRVKDRDRLGCSFEMTVRVLRPALKQRLKEDKIIE